MMEVNRLLLLKKAGHLSMAMSGYKETKYKEGDKGSPFTDDIMVMPLPPKFKESIDIEGYGRTLDPQDHLNTFQSCMYLSGATDVIKCKAFSITLRN